ncbi:hypothetical protein F4604DRAFT_1297589 [Suillus subluteus]|nr:hypothetical protein F4604DRAFT_1297589 [Suillus subluteus]
MATVIPWKDWGPSSTRIFEHDCSFGVGVGGSRVLRAVPTAQSMDDSDDPTMEYRLHMMDFNPLAVLHQQGLGRVVREPSMIDLEGELVTTSLAYVEVVSSRNPFRRTMQPSFGLITTEFTPFIWIRKVLRSSKFSAGTICDSESASEVPRGCNDGLILAQKPQAC